MPFRVIGNNENVQDMTLLQRRHSVFRGRTVLHLKCLSSNYPPSFPLFGNLKLQAMVHILIQRSKVIVLHKGWLPNYNRDATLTITGNDIGKREFNVASHVDVLGNQW
jgi:hypothetical protein